MEELKFKDVAHMYLGCKMMLEGQVFDFTPSNIPSNWQSSEWLEGMKPILFPLSAMTKHQGIEILRHIVHPHVEYPETDYTVEFNGMWGTLVVGISNNHYDVTMNIGLDCSIWFDDVSDYTHKIPSSVYLILLRNHFNVFNLPESEFIDASKLPVNPYLKS